VVPLTAQPSRAAGALQTYIPVLGLLSSRPEVFLLSLFFLLSECRWVRLSMESWRKKRRVEVGWMDGWKDGTRRFLVALVDWDASPKLLGRAGRKPGAVWLAGLEEITILY
jgi:hypothetical protein